MKDKRLRSPLVFSPHLIAKKCKLLQYSCDARLPCDVVPSIATGLIAEPRSISSGAMVNGDLYPHGSGLPSSLMFYEGGQWKNFSLDASRELRLAFQAGNWVPDISIHGKRYRVSFTEMLRLDLNTAYMHSIAWIDVNGKCFYPTKCFEGYGCNDMLQSIITSPASSSQDEVFQTLRSASHLNLNQSANESLQKRANTGKTQESCIGGLGILRTTQSTEDSSMDSLNSSVTSESLEHSDVSSCMQRDSAQESPSSYYFQNFALLHDKIAWLDELDPGFDNVKRRFLAGLGKLAPYTTVTGISKNCHCSISGHLRYQIFRQQEEVTQRTRGDANIRHGWYGTSKQGVSSIILHGFGQPKMSMYGSMYGTGIYLTSEKYSHLSAVFSDVDENGEQHVVLCRAIMGNMEQVARGTDQFHPSSEIYDTGVDDLSDPKRYIVWSTHMNTHILPEYIVSFKFRPRCQEILSKLRTRGFLLKKVSLERGTLKDGQSARKVNNTLSISRNETNQRPPHGPPRSPWMSFPKLFMLMKTKLPQASMDILQRHYMDFKAKRMSRSALIKIVRSIAGDKLVGDSIKSKQTQSMGEAVVQSLLVSEKGEVVNNTFIP